MFPQQYEIRVRGRLPGSLQEVFAPMASLTEENDSVTVLHGLVHDQSQLTGILSTIDSVGLVLLEVRPSAAQPPGSTDS